MVLANAIGLPKQQLSMMAHYCITLVVMGILSVALALLTGSTYQDITIQNQSTSISQLIEHETSSVLSLLDKDAAELALSINTMTGFKKAISEKETSLIGTTISNQFNRYYVTAGVINLVKISILDEKLKLIQHSDRGFQAKDDSILCGEIIKRLDQKPAYERLKPIGDFCEHRNNVYYSLIAPIGTLKPIGYIQLIMDPVERLESHQLSLQVPIKIIDNKGIVTFISDDWPENGSQNHSNLASYAIKGKNQKLYYTIQGNNDLSVINTQLRKLQAAVIIIAILSTLTVILISLFFLKKTVLNPINLLQQQLIKISDDETSLGERVSIEGTPEINSLSLQFNLMTEKLHNLYARLSTNQSLLETKIHERETYEALLQDANQVLVERTNELQKMSSIAKQANQAKTEFLSSMSHELRTPLNAIIGFTQIMQLESNTHHTEIRQIHQAGQHLLGLINEILDLTTIESGKLKLNIENVSMTQTIDDALSMIKPMADKKGINITYNPSSFEDHCVKADDSRLRQVLINLLSNAVKYNLDGGSITIEIHADDQRVTTSVIDTGPGLDEQQLSIIFQPFNRLGAELKKIEGTGIGLSISKRIIELMNGTLDVTSRIGEGSKFSFSLTRSARNETPVTSKPFNKASDFLASDETNGTSAKQVLLAEDNEVNQLVAKRFLEKLGHNITIAENGSIAVDLCHETRFDLIFMDLNMPIMDGLEAASSIRTISDWYANVPIIALTANVMEGSKADCFAAGMSDLLEKPLSYKKLTSKLQQIFS